MGNDDVFDFLISDQKEVFLIMHARETEPDNPAVRLDEKAGIVELYRSAVEQYTLENVDAEVFKLLQNEQNLLVCEIASTENEEETEIDYTYQALIIE